MLKTDDHDGSILCNPVTFPVFNRCAQFFRHKIHSVLGFWNQHYISLSLIPDIHIKAMDFDHIRTRSHSGSAVQVSNEGETTKAMDGL